MKLITFLALLIAFPIQAQVIDVDGDQVVGPHEAIAVAGEWKQDARAADDHDHLGQTWEGNRDPLTIRGNFPPRPIIVPAKEGQKANDSIPSAPLILDNTTGASPVGLNPDLILGGSYGTMSAVEESASSMVLVSNGGIFILLNSAKALPHSWIDIYNGDEHIVVRIDDSGNIGILGTLTTAGGTYKIDHPQDPTNKYLSHSNVGCPEMMNIYRGNVVLNDQGEAEVDLPEYFEAFNADFSYHLTPVGAPSPNLYVADKIKNNQFKIAGGKPKQEISWQVTGIRQDAYAKAHPIEVEKEKTGEEKGKYLHPELFGEPVEKSVGLVSPE